MKQSLLALILTFGMATGAQAATSPTFKTCQPFYFVEDANSFANLNLTQAQRDGSQLVLLPQYECPQNATCNEFLWVLIYSTTAADALVRGCGKVPGQPAQGSNGPFGF